MPRPRRIDLEVLAQIDDEIVDRPRGRHVRHPPDVLQELGASDDQALVLDEVSQQFHFGVRELLRLVHVEQIDLSQVKRVDFEIISYLKESHPDLYRSLRRAVRSKHKRPDGEPGDLAADSVMRVHAEASAEDVTGTS